MATSAIHDISCRKIGVGEGEYLFSFCPRSGCKGIRILHDITLFIEGGGISNSPAIGGA